jgi:hypothetical protein
MEMPIKGVGLALAAYATLLEYQARLYKPLAPRQLALQQQQRPKLSCHFVMLEEQDASEQTELIACSSQMPQVIVRVFHSILGISNRLT